MSYQFLDELIKEYLLFRGFTSSLRAFDSDIKTEKEKSFRADRLVDSVLSLISTHDLTSLRELWQHLQSRLFKRLDPVQNGAALRLESGILKLYLVNCIQTKRPEKVKEFFEKMAVELQGASEWSQWFAMPFLQSPESHPTFQTYFSRQWQDTLLLSLHNFLSLVFSRLSPPKLAEFQSTSTKLKRLKEENDVLRQTLIKQRHQNAANATEGSASPGVGIVRFPDTGIQQRDLMDDFYIIAQQDSSSSASGGNNSNDTQVKTLKSFLRNITGANAGTSSPTSANLLNVASERKAKRLSQEDVGGSVRKPTPEPTVSASKGSHTPLKRVAQSVPLQAPETLVASDNDADPGSGRRIAYLLLGQEEYKEHHSEITQCKFSGSGCLIGSSDVDGVVKIWSSSPGIPHTVATFVSTCSVTTLDWLPNSDRHFVYGTSNGSIRLCDADDRKVITEVTTNTGAVQQSIQQISCSPNNGSVVAISTAPANDQNSEGSLMLYDIKSSSYLERDLTGSLSGSIAATVPLIMTTAIFNHNSQMLITGATDAKIRIFDLRKRECIASWSVAGEDEKSSVVSLQLSHDETRIYALTSDGGFSAWSLVQTSQKLFGAQLEDSYFSEPEVYKRSYWGKQFSFAGDGHHFLSCSSNGGVIYDVRSAGNVEKILGLKGHGAYATCTDWSASNDCGPCVTASVDGQIRISTLLSQ